MTKAHDEAVFVLPSCIVKLKPYLFERPALPPTEFLENCEVHCCDGVRAVVGETICEKIDVVWLKPVVLHASQVHLEELVLIRVLVPLAEVGEQGLGGVHSVNLTKQEVWVPHRPQDRLV